MGIRNYSTTINPAKAIGKIVDLLARNGAHHVAMDYHDGEPAAVTFRMEIGGNSVAFRLEPDEAGMLAAMRQDKTVPRSKCKPEQARRTAWKNELEWLDIQLAKIAAGQARLEQLLLGYAITDDGKTVFEKLQQSPHLLLSN